jgi:hypothetical protein
VRARPTIDEARFANAVSTQLCDFEQKLGVGRYKELQFKLIHARHYELFVRSMGFGVARMLQPMPEGPRRPPLRDIRYNEAAADPSQLSNSEWDAPSRVGKASNIGHLHEASRLDFLDPESFGATLEPRRTVVGFIQHAFHFSPAASLEDPHIWTIDRLELVSLLKFDEPRVYVLDHLPRMDQLSSDNVPTRPLDEFESGSLEKLRTDEDLVITNAGPAYRMLGSLRAAKQCLNCHTAERGDLLGAFSYAMHANSPGDE